MLVKTMGIVDIVSMKVILNSAADSVLSIDAPFIFRLAASITKVVAHLLNA
jgi:hypothetical protein